MSNAPEISSSFDYSRQLDGQVALITGGSRGIGRAIAEKFASQGASVVINSTENSRPQAEEVVEKIILEGGNALYIAGDVSQFSTGRNLVEQTVKSFGGIDILVSNAGITADNLLMRMSEDQWDRVINTNLTGAGAVSKYTLFQMLRQKRGGSLIYISSVVAHGNPGQANYAASKAGVEGLMRTAAVEGSAFGVRANAIACGFVETDMTDKLKEEQKEALKGLTLLRRALQPDEIANVALFLASKMSSSITGEVVNADGGMRRD